MNHKFERKTIDRSCVFNYTSVRDFFSKLQIFPATKYGKKGITSIYRIRQLYDVVKKKDDFMEAGCSGKNYRYPGLDRDKKIRQVKPVKGDGNKSSSAISRQSRKSPEQQAQVPY